MHRDRAPRSRTVYGCAGVVVGERLGWFAAGRSGIRKKAMPAVSCIIPTHDRPQLLRLSIASVLEQSSLPLEIVVASDVDDAATRALCDELAAAAPIPVRYVHDPAAGRGASASRNTGAAVARGDVFAFLDDDDLWLPGYLEHALAAMTATGRDMAVTWRMMARGAVRVDGPTLEEGLRARDVIAVSLGTTGSNMVVTAAAFAAIGGFDPAIPVKNDTDFFYRFLHAGFDYAVVRDRLVVQVKHGGPQLTGNSESRATGTEAYMRKHAAALRLRDRRHLRLSIHRIRYHNAGNPVQRYKHLALALLNYSPAKYLQERGLRRMWLALEREDAAS